jgi:hypothetical protein
MFTQNKERLVNPDTRNGSLFLGYKKKSGRVGSALNLSKALQGGGTNFYSRALSECQ